ncbi:MAG: glycosyl transferase family protein [Sphingopyxis sp.]|uniref:glycosyl transferase family protein n=1 Tax=Sphingopyxis sp. TaxID=1908224 RepID=UPI002AB8F28E|nr:glycosyl transferase family protein [Sphingopyxis sp.]MDZ3830497.1 glycosyl transferase family protein [Sphingopyxis sp.]
MDFWIAWAQWLVQGVGYELMLFASVGILLIGIDDLSFDVLWFVRRARQRPPLAPLGEGPRLNGRIALFVPAWDERRALPAMLRRTLAAWDGHDFRIYIGCYPNDLGTLRSVSGLVSADHRLRLVVGERDGPTTKGDNLNRLWAAMGADERSDGMRFAAVVLHDVEDHVHPGELDLYRRLLVDHAMVQIPVVPFVDRAGRWVGGHYADEFAETHGKELGLRSELGVPIPSAGVGCALGRGALALLAIERGGSPFRADSLTEDYEVGLLIGAYGLRACFADCRDARGERIVSRGPFPVTLEAAVRQKARWIAGIALAGWAHLGWLASDMTAPGQGWARRWLNRWMLWRDRRAPLAALIVLAAYAALIFAGLDWIGQRALGWPAPDHRGTVDMLLTASAALLIWRLGMRGHFTARWYGIREALFALPRAFIANVIAILAARRALSTYWRMWRSGKVVWDKTAHDENMQRPQPAPARGRLP